MASSYIKVRPSNGKKHRLLHHLFKRGVPLLALQCISVLISNESMWKSVENPDADGTEFFAGMREFTKACWRHGKVVLPFEINDDVPGGRFDINSDAGFATALHMVLRCKPGSINVFAPVCSTWVWVNRGTSARTEWDPLGDVNKPQVVAANKMVARCVILLMIVAARGGLWILEQPASSILSRHPSFQSMLRHVAVWKAFVYMGAFGAESLKPTSLWANDKCIQELEEQGKTKPDTVSKTGIVEITYSASGRLQVMGGAKLKQTQHYPKGFGDALNKMHDANHARLKTKKRCYAYIDEPMTLFKKARSIKDRMPLAEIESVLTYLTAS